MAPTTALRRAGVARLSNAEDHGRVQPAEHRHVLLGREPREDEGRKDGRDDELDVTMRLHAGILGQACERM
jgi:hypothetical protein